MDPISALTSLAPLILEWAKERRDRGEEASEEAFRAWLQEVAFEGLLDATKVAFKTVLVSQKAHHHELIGFLTQQFSEVQSTLKERLGGGPSVPTLQMKWQDLRSAGQLLLNRLVEQVGDGDTYEDAQLSAPYDVIGATREDVIAGKKRIVEAGLAREAEYSGGATLRLTAMGLLISEAIVDSEDFQSKLLRIQHGLKTYGGAPVDKLVAHSGKRCSPALLYAIVERWDKMGWVTLQKLDQRRHSRISHPTQQMLDANADRLMQATLRPFVGPN